MSETTTLEWSKTLCDGEYVQFEQAEKAIAELGPEWRLPTLHEAFAANNYSQYPVVQEEGVETGYQWTSTPCPWASESAVFVVSSSLGYVYDLYRYLSALVRAVRAVPGQ